ncbi:unnamed protein product [Arctia plantaginis]|uniref:Pre-piRNA 3'-exonuclease trimmer n=1 Tax=Arctia plantaginis TaxID=874455 RepID=A0A8S0Z6K4_ARCPL|nr:unnamed protein product [Arctia plantaginis]
MEITKNNFTEQLVNITKDLKKACFVGFDAEFTSILSGDRHKYRLFDTNEERYEKLKNEVRKMMMTQVGLTMFQYERDLDTYIATAYTFHLCPQSFGDLDQSFIFIASSLKFLCRHNFDFNKFLYEGLPFLSKAEEAKVRQDLKDKTMPQKLTQSLDISEERLLQGYCSQVSKWQSTSEDDTIYLDVENPILRYLVHNEIRIRFPNMLTTDSLGNSKKILIYRDKHVEGANSAPMAIIEEDLMNNLLGFSRIISLLETLQKPIIGHNIFLDIVFLHNQFIGPLPSKYSVFKKNIHNMLPHLYDTKYISSEMSKMLSYHEVWRSNMLQDLYEFFAEGKCRKLQNGVSFIKVSQPFNVKQTYHEAGWDSFCSGYCFIRLGHWMACENSGTYRPVGPTETVAAMAPFANKVNIIRGAIPYMSLVGADPPSHRPGILLIETLAQRTINVGQVASVLASCGSVDVKPYGRRTALLASGTNITVDRIMKSFKDSKEYRITTFNTHKYSLGTRMAMWSGALLTGTLVVYMLHKKVKILI